MDWPSPYSTIQPGPIGLRPNKPWPSTVLLGRAENCQPQYEPEKDKRKQKSERWTKSFNHENRIQNRNDALLLLAGPFAGAEDKAEGRSPLSANMMVEAVASDHPPEKRARFRRGACIRVYFLNLYSWTQDLIPFDIL